MSNRRNGKFPREQDLKLAQLGGKTAHLGTWVVTSFYVYLQNDAVTAAAAVTRSIFFSSVRGLSRTP